MSEKEKKIVEKLKEAIPKMSEFDKGYILGKVESFSDNNLEQKTDKKELQKSGIVQKNEKSGADAQRKYCTLHISAAE